MKELSVATALLIFTISVPANATIIGGSVTGGTAQTAGGTFVKLTVLSQIRLARPIAWATTPF